MEVIPHFLFIQCMIFILNILGDVSHTDMQVGVLDVAKVAALRDTDGYSYMSRVNLIWTLAHQR